MGVRDRRVDAYIGRAAPFARPILEHLRERVHRTCPDCEEAIKWGMPSFLHRGKLLCSMAAFKQHATFGLWQGRQVLGEGEGQPDAAMGQYGRLTSVADLPDDRELTAHLEKAMALIEGGVPRRPAIRKAPRPEAEVPADLAQALAGNPAARASFEGFPPSARREYIEWLLEAKREDTRRKRLVQAVEWMAEGKRRNWKYENC